MKYKTFFLLISSILFFQSCATTHTHDITLTSVPSPEQKIGYDGTLFSQKKHSLSLTPYTDFDSAIPEFDLAANTAKFMLTVQNGGKEPIIIGRENISAIIEDDGNDGELKKLNVQSLDEFMENFEKEYNNNELAFLYSKFYRYYQRIGSQIRMAEEHQGFISLEYWEERLQDLIWDLERVRRTKEGLQEALPRIILTRQTIMPARSYTGIFICDTSDLAPEMEVTFRITVSVDGEEHLFTFNRRPP